MTVETIKIPDLGGATDVEVIEVCVAPGDVIKADQSLLVLESDKASMEVPSPKAGKVVAIKLAAGSKVNVGDVMIELEVEAAAASTPAPVTASAAKTNAAPEAKPVAQSITQPVTPSVASAAMAAPAVVASLSPSPSVQLVSIPDIGTDDAVDLIEISVKVGDVIAEGASLIVLESDKASMEVPSPYAGTVQSILIKEGSKVKKGDAILEVLVKGAAAPVPAPAKPDGVHPAERVITPQPIHVPETRQVAGVSESRPSGDVYAGPAVRKYARELGVDLATVAGSGPRGRIVKEDIQAFVKDVVQQRGKAASSSAVLTGAGIPPIPAVDFALFGAINIEPLSKLHKVTAANMHRSWLNVPHVTQFDDVDITELEDFRASIKGEMDARKIKLTPLPFLLKAAAAALKVHPKFCSSLSADGESLVYKQYVHIGIAVDTPAGLVVPVIRDVDKKGIWELAQESADLAARAKDRKLKPEEMKGGCFTISSLGNTGGTGFTPIINAPEVAILGVSKLDIKPVWNGKEFVPRKMLPLALSYDHRVVNGADAGRFFTYFNTLLVDIRKLVL